MKPTQADRILERLREQGAQGVTNVELNNMHIYRYSARVHDLREKGHVIEAHHLKGGMWKFVLLTGQGRLF